MHGRSSAYGLRDHILGSGIQEPISLEFPDDCADSIPGNFHRIASSHLNPQGVAYYHAIVHIVSYPVHRPLKKEVVPYPK